MKQIQAGEGKVFQRKSTREILGGLLILGVNDKEEYYEKIPMQEENLYGDNSV